MRMQISIDLKKVAETLAVMFGMVLSVALLAFGLAYGWTMGAAFANWLGS